MLRRTLRDLQQLRWQRVSALLAHFAHRFRHVPARARLAAPIRYGTGATGISRALSLPCRAR